MRSTLSRWLVAVAVLPSCLALEHAARADEPPRVEVKIDVEQSVSAPGGNLEVVPTRITIDGARW